MLLRLVTGIIIGLLATGLQAGENPGWNSAASVSPSQAAAWLQSSDARAAASEEQVPNGDRTALQSGDNKLSAQSAIEGPVAQALVVPPTTPGGNEADEITPDISTLAAGLFYDPVRIFEYVHNYIDYEPYYGSKKGAHLTLLEGSGNDFDQCSLLVALLRASGKAPSYKFAPCDFSYSELTRWMGLSTNPYSHWNTTDFTNYYGGVPDTLVNRKKLAVYEHLTAGGFFYVEPFTVGSEVWFSIPHVYVELTMGGTAYKLSPSWKDYKDYPGIDLSLATGYSRTQMLSDAAGTEVASPDSVTGLSYSAISSRLSTYTQNFLNYVRANAHGMDVENITGSRRIIHKSYATLSEIFAVRPYASSSWLVPETWSAVPDVQMSKLVITAGTGVYNETAGTFGTDLFPAQTLKMPGLKGRKLSLAFSGNTASIRIDETLVASAFTVAGSSVSVRLKATHNHYELAYVSGSGTYAVIPSSVGKSNQAEIKPYFKASDNAYAFIYSFANPDRTSRARQEVLDGYRRSGLTETDWRVRTEILNIMGLQWLYQSWQADRVTAPLFKVLPMEHHRFGRVGQENNAAITIGFYIDVGLQTSAVSHRNQDFARKDQFNYFSSFIASAMEHGVIEQMQGEDKSAASTVRMVYLANQANIPVYRATAANWTTINTSTNLINYPAPTITEIGNAVTDPSKPGSKALLPRDGLITLNHWKGLGFAIEQPGYVAMKISGDYFGGYSSLTGAVNLTPMAGWIVTNPGYISNAGTFLQPPYTAYTTPPAQSTDPVDMASGAFMLDKTELTLGSGAAPRGLAFSRSYNSNRRYDKSSGLGYGWTHNYDITVARRSSVKAGLGGTISYHGAPFFTALQVASDLYTSHAKAKDWVTSALVIHWAVEQLKYNAVAVTMGGRTIEFVKMPSGAYEAPAGMNLTLVSNGTGPSQYYTMTERHGATYTFNTSGQIATITDLQSKTQTFTYTGGLLTSVTDGYSRPLTFTRTAGRIDSISDATGRTVSFTYTGDKLTGGTDVENKTWNYQYDAEYRMTHSLDPTGRVIVQNSYDAQGRVVWQRSMGQSTKEYTLSYTGYCNTERNPADGVVSFLFDDRGRSIANINPLGERWDYFYDGQDRMVQTISPKGEFTESVYDKNNNLVESWDEHLYEWSPVLLDYVLSTTAPGYHSYTSFDPQNRVQTMQDKRGKITTVNSYNAQFQPLQVTAPLARITQTTYTTSGVVDTITDPENNVTQYLYNALDQVITVKLNGVITQEFTYTNRGDVETSKNGLGRVTSFTYNKRRQTRTTTLPPVSLELAATIERTYDNEGNLSSLIDALGNTISYAYSATGKLLTTTEPGIMAGGVTLNNVTTNTYNSRDLAETTYNSLGHTSRIDYDAALRPMELRDPLLRLTTQVHDSNGKLSKVTDPLLRTKQMEYTPRGEIYKDTDAALKNSFNSYDANGNPIKFTNRRSNEFIMGYDDANRQSSISTPLGKLTSKTYWKNDLLKTITEPSLQQTTFNYDSRKRLYTKVDPISTITYGYDAADNLLTVKEGAGPSITRTYDERSRLKTFTNVDGDVIGYSYDSNNNLRWIIYPPDTDHPTGKKVTYTYNARNQMETVKDWANRLTTYKYDRLGRITGVDRSYNGTSQAVELDAAGQMLSLREKAGTRLFYYQKFVRDAAGQVKEKFSMPAAHPWADPAFSATADNDNRLASVNGASTTFDNDGNLTLGPITSDGPQYLTYNARNQLTDVGLTHYAYDAEGRRRSVYSGVTGGTTRYTIDPNGPLSRCLIRHNPDGTRTYYVYGLGLLYETFRLGANPESTITYHYDQVGSTVARTDDAGKEIGRAEYSPYGQITFRSGNMNTPFLYNGSFGVMTDDNGLLHMRARYYSPYLMRFLNPDPIGFSGGSNWFAFADGNPISLNDPFGLFGWPSWTQVGGAIKALGGLLEVAGGISLTTGTGGIGAAAGWAIAAHGVDTAFAGMRQMYKDEEIDTGTSNLIQAAGVDRNNANLIDAGLGLASGGLSLRQGLMKTAEVMRTPEAAGMSVWRALDVYDNGSLGLVDDSFKALGGFTTTPMQKGLMMAKGVNAAGEAFEPVLSLGRAASLVRTGMTPRLDLFIGGANTLRNGITVIK